jgi:hypothetical protein
MFTSRDILRVENNDQRTLLWTSANQKRHYLKSYNNRYYRVKVNYHINLTNVRQALYSVVYNRFH